MERSRVAVVITAGLVGLVSVASHARDAHAEPLPLPGTADDVAERIALLPSVGSTPLVPLTVRGGTPEDTVILLDGFEIPQLQYARALRSVIAQPILREATLRTAPDVGTGRAATAVALTTGVGQAPAAVLEASTFEVGLLAGVPGSVGVFRRSVADAVTGTSSFDVAGRREWQPRGRWRPFVSGFVSVSESTPDDIEAETSMVRTILGATHVHGGWRTSVAVSGLWAHQQRTRGLLQRQVVSRTSLDTRAEIVRSLPRAVGLTDVEWRLGEQSYVSYHDLDVAWPALPREGVPAPAFLADDDTTTTVKRDVWAPDLAAWSSLAANLAPNIRATAGVRVDVFGRTQDVATQPRGDIVVGLTPHTRIGLAAGAYRRAPQHADELFTDALNPERTTQVMLRGEHVHGPLAVNVDAYYADRTRLIVRDPTGVLRNSGLGTSYGVELSARWHTRAWLVWLTGALSHAERRDFLRSYVRPSQYDQPIRASLLASWRQGRWTVGGRVQLASGLPTTSIQTAVYDADRDVYQPIFGIRTYDERLPMRYELALRVDRRFPLRLGRGVLRIDAFADLQLSTSTIDYRYRYDYTERVSVTLPIVPFAGIRGQL